MSLQRNLSSLAPRTHDAKEGTANNEVTITSNHEGFCNEPLAMNQNSSSLQKYPPRPVRMWFNTLLEFHEGKTTVLRSYSTPAKDSDVQRVAKKKVVKKKVAEAPKVQQQEEEVY